MATKVYLSSDEWTRYDPSTRRGAWDKTSGIGAFTRMSKVPTGGGDIAANTDTNATVNYDVLITGGVSDPLLNNVTISGTLDFALLMGETNADTDASLHLHVWVTQGDSATARGTLLTDYIHGSELPVTTSAQTAGVAASGISLTSVNALKGDRIVVEIGAQCANNFSTTRTLTCARGSSITAADATGSETAGASGLQPNPWFLFSTDFDFDMQMLYLTSQSAPVTPGSTLGTWDVAGSPSDYYLATAKGGSRTSAINTTETTTTAPWDAIHGRFVSDILASQTIPNMTVWAWANQNESSISADARMKLHLWVMKPDGTSRGTLISNSAGAGEFATSANPVPQSHSLTGMAVLNGDRLVMEFGVRFTNVTATSQQANSWFGNTDADGPGGNPTSDTLKSGWLQIPKRILFSSGGSNLGGQAVMIC